MRRPLQVVLKAASFGAVLSVLTLLELVLLPTKQQAMPMFARKYNVDCSTCHSVIPRLNGTGYKFRAAGFRMPEEIGKEQETKFELGDYFAGRVQARYDTVEQSYNNAIPSQRTGTHSLSFMELTVYPMTGSWGKYASSLVELSIAPEDFNEIENAYVRFNIGNKDRFFTARAGIFHPYEGFGGSDRPFANSRPLFQRVFAKNGAIPTLFIPWGLDEAGAEVGADYKKLSVRGTVFNGTIIKFVEEANTFLPFPAQTGPFKGPTGVPSGLPRPGSFPGSTGAAHSTPDFQFFANYILHEDGGGVSFYYYHGNMSTPTKVSKPPVATDLNNPQYRNNFDRVAFYGAYPIGRVLAQGGYQFGRDTLPSGARFDSRGMFAEAAVGLNDYSSAGFRYDWFDPSTAIAKNEQWSVTPYVNIPLQNGFQIIAEYQHRNYKQGLVADKKDDLFQVRVIFIK